MSRCVGPSCALSVLPTFLSLLLNIRDILRTKLFQNPKSLSRGEFLEFFAGTEALKCNTRTKKC